MEVPRLGYEELSDDRLREQAEAVRQRVEQARSRQRERLKGTSILCKAEVRREELRDHCYLDFTAQSLMQAAMNQMHLSA